MTKAAAIRQATDQCTPVYRIAHNKYTFNVLNPKTLESVRQPVRNSNDSNVCRSAFIVNQARALLGREPVLYEHKPRVRYDSWI